MIKRSCVTGLLIFLLLPGCGAAWISQKTDFKYTNDKFTGENACWMTGNRAETRFGGLALTAGKIWTQNGVEFAFKVTHTVESELNSNLNIEKGHKLWIIAGDTRLVFEAFQDGKKSGPLMGIASPLWIDVSEYRNITEEQIKTIASAKTVEFKVEGKGTAIEGKMTKKNIDAFKEFLLKCNREKSNSGKSSTRRH